MRFGGRGVGAGSAPLVIAEMSGNHNQSLERALEIVDAAAKAGAHAIKIQTYTAETMTLDIREREFFISDPKSLWKGSSLYELYEKAYTPWEWHKPIFDRAHQHGMIAFSTPFDDTAVDYLEQLNVPCYKIASFENTDLPLIRRVAATRKPIIISTGMTTFAELDETGKYKYAFGGDGSGLNIDLTETKAFLQLAEGLGIQLICISAASPYYNPHLMRPAIFPPSDGYSPPEEPLAGVARMINITAELKNAFPNLFIVGSGYTYLQDWLPNVGQYVLRNQMADFIGLGRMVLSYPTMPDDIINGRPLERKQICRTFSDCTTAPRNGIISGCYPLDLFYKNLPQAEQLKETKKLL